MLRSRVLLTCLVMLLGGAGFSFAQAPLFLIRDGQPACTIVRGETDDFAAERLARWFAEEGHAQGRRGRCTEGRRAGSRRPDPHRQFRIEPCLASGRRRCAARYCPRPSHRSGIRRQDAAPRRPRLADPGRRRPRRGDPCRGRPDQLAPPAPGQQRFRADARHAADPALQVPLVLELGPPHGLGRTWPRRRPDGRRRHVQQAARSVSDRFQELHRLHGRPQVQRPDRLGLFARYARGRRGVAGVVPLCGAPRREDPARRGHQRLRGLLLRGRSRLQRRLLDRRAPGTEGGGKERSPAQCPVPLQESQPGLARRRRQVALSDVPDRRRQPGDGRLLRLLL